MSLGVKVIDSISSISTIPALHSHLLMSFSFNCSRENEATQNGLGPCPPLLRGAREALSLFSLKAHSYRFPTPAPREKA